MTCVPVMARSFLIAAATFSEAYRPGSNCNEDYRPGAVSGPAAGCGPEQSIWALDQIRFREEKPRLLLGVLVRIGRVDCVSLL
jgi:hypothetical protein